MKVPVNPANDPALEDLVARARSKAAVWRGRGAGAASRAEVHPPPQSALLATYLTSFLGSPIEIPAPPRSLKGRLTHKLFGAERARVDRLMSYAGLLTEDMAKTICRLEVELAELRARVGLVEDRQSPPGTDREGEE